MQNWTGEPQGAVWHDSLNYWPNWRHSSTVASSTRTDNAPCDEFQFIFFCGQKLPLYKAMIYFVGSSDLQIGPRMSGQGCVTASSYVPQTKPMYNDRQDEKPKIFWHGPKACFVDINMPNVYMQKDILVQSLTAADNGGRLNVRLTLHWPINDDIACQQQTLQWDDTIKLSFTIKCLKLSHFKLCI